MSLSWRVTSLLLSSLVLRPALMLPGLMVRPSGRVMVMVLLVSLL